jgi:N-acyl-D-amino-acid deacylase
MIGSDGEIPEFYGTFARVLARYVRERKTLTLEDAVRKMSGCPAGRLRLLEILTNTPKASGTNQ